MLTKTLLHMSLSAQKQTFLWLYVVVIQSLSGVWLFVTPMDCSTLDFHVLHYLLEFAQTHVHWVDDAIQPSYPLLSWPLLLLPSIFPGIRVFSNNLALCIRWLKYWSFSFSINLSNEPLKGWFPLGLTGLIPLLFKGHSRVFSSTTIWKHQFFHVQPSL